MYMHLTYPKVFLNNGCEQGPGRDLKHDQIAWADLLAGSVRLFYPGKSSDHARFTGQFFRPRPFYPAKHARFTRAKAHSTPVLPR